MVIDKLAKWICSVSENGEPYDAFATMSWEELSIGAPLEDIREGFRGLARQLLKDIPELAVVDRKAELPKCQADSILDIAVYKQALKDMLDDGWVKEVKE